MFRAGLPSMLSRLREAYADIEWILTLLENPAGAVPVAFVHLTYREGAILMYTFMESNVIGYPSGVVRLIGFEVSFWP
jgi:hypothetical protein